MTLCQASGQAFARRSQVFQHVISPSVGMTETFLIKLDRVPIVRPSNDQVMVDPEPKRDNLLLTNATSEEHCPGGQANESFGRGILRRLRTRSMATHRLEYLASRA